MLLNANRLEFYGEMHYEGECSPNPKNPPPAKQVCTPPLHYHRNQVERFDVLEGEIAYLAQGKEGRIGKGEHITLPAGAPHTYWNSGKDTLKYKVTITATKHSYPIGVADDTFFGMFVLHPLTIYRKFLWFGTRPRCKPTKPVLPAR
jgi:mannose-6-phosphate isomerase-like protein (cupin superfamily)